MSSKYFIVLRWSSSNAKTLAWNQTFIQTGFLLDMLKHVHFKHFTACINRNWLLDRIVLSVSRKIKDSEFFCDCRLNHSIPWQGKIILNLFLTVYLDRDQNSSVSVSELLLLSNYLQSSATLNCVCGYLTC